MTCNTHNVQLVPAAAWTITAALPTQPSQLPEYTRFSRALEKSSCFTFAEISQIAPLPGSLLPPFCVPPTPPTRDGNGKVCQPIVTGRTGRQPPVAPLMAEGEKDASSARPMAEKKSEPAAAAASVSPSSSSAAAPGSIKDAIAAFSKGELCPSTTVLHMRVCRWFCLYWWYRGRLRPYSPCFILVPTFTHAHNGSLRSRVGHKYPVEIRFLEDT